MLYYQFDHNKNLNSGKIGSMKTAHEIALLLNSFLIVGYTKVDYIVIPSNPETKAIVDKLIMDEGLLVSEVENLPIDVINNHIQFQNYWLGLRDKNPLEYAWRIKPVLDELEKQKWIRVLDVEDFKKLPLLQNSLSPKSYPCMVFIDDKKIGLTISELIYY